jgi:hypothetical protein
MVTRQSAAALNEFVNSFLICIERLMTWVYFVPESVATVNLMAYRDKYKYRIRCRYTN